MVEGEKSMGNYQDMDNMEQDTDDLVKNELGQSEERGEEDFFINDFEDYVDMEDGSIHKYNTVDLDHAREMDAEEEEMLICLIQQTKDIVDKINDKIDNLTGILEKSYCFQKKKE